MPRLIDRDSRIVTNVTKRHGIVKERYSNLATGEWLDILFDDSDVVTPVRPHSVMLEEIADRPVTEESREYL
jgi:hypothetical protein